MGGVVAYSDSNLFVVQPVTSASCLPTLAFQVGFIGAKGVEGSHHLSHVEAASECGPSADDLVMVVGE